MTSTSLPDGWLIREKGGGWYWTDRRIAATAALTEGLTVVSLGPVKDSRLVQTQYNRICRICDGGPGNEGVCLCGEKAWSDTGQDLIAFSLRAARVLRTMLDARNLQEGVAVTDELITRLEAASENPSPQPRTDES